MRQVSPNNIQPIWQTKAQIMERLSISRATLYRRIEAGLIESRRDGRRCLFRELSTSSAPVSTDETVETVETPQLSHETCLTETIDETGPSDGVGLLPATALLERLAASEFERGKLLQSHQTVLEEARSWRLSAIEETKRAERLQALVIRQDKHLRELQRLVDTQEQSIQTLLNILDLHQLQNSSSTLKH